MEFKIRATTSSSSASYLQTSLVLILVISLLLLLAPQQCSSQRQPVSLEKPVQKYYIASKIDEPYLMKTNATKGNNDQYEGFAKDLADKLATKLKFDYEFDVSAEKYGHRFRNGSWNGIIDMLIRKPGDEYSDRRKIHIAIAAITITAARNQVVRFSPPFMEFQFALLMNKPVIDIDTDSAVGGYEEPHAVYQDEDDDVAEDTQYIFLRPMTAWLWIVFLLSIYLIVVLIYIIERVIATKWSAAQEEVINRERPADSQVTVLPKPVGLCTNGIIGSPRTTAGRCLQIFFWVYLAIFVAAYIATFAADRVVDQLNNEKETTFDPKSWEPIVNTLEELIEQDEIRYTALKGGSTMDYFMRTSNRKYRKALSQMNYNSDKIAIRSIEEGVKKVRSDNGSFVFISEEPTARYHAGKPPCDLIVSKQLFGPKLGFGIAMSKDLPQEFVKEINLAILEMRENEELEDLERIWFEDLRVCPRDPRLPVKSWLEHVEDENEDALAEGGDNATQMDDGDNGGGTSQIVKVEDDNTKDAALCVQEMAGAFYLLATALIIALIIAIAEICFTARKTIPSNSSTRDDKGIELQPQGQLQQYQLQSQPQPLMQQQQPVSAYQPQPPPPSPRIPTQPQRQQQPVLQQRQQQPQQRGPVTRQRP